MTEPLPRLLLRLSEAGEPAILWGRLAAPYAGRAFDRLLGNGVLIEQAPASDWDVCPDCNCGLDARPIQEINGRHTAACPIDRRSDVALGEDDLRSFRIHSPALVREIAMASGFGDTPSPVTACVWHLGQTPNQRALFLALSRDGVRQPGLISLMRSIVRASPITVIAPATAGDDLVRLVDAGILVVSMQDCIGGNVAAFAIDLSMLEYAPTAEPLLVIFRQGQRVILDGSEMHIPQQPFNLLVRLAEAVTDRSGYLTPHQIEAENSGRGAADLVRELRRFLSETRQGRGATLIKTRRSPTGYFLALQPEGFDLRP